VEKFLFGEKTGAKEQVSRNWISFIINGKKVRGKHVTVYKG
jgi:hypothetical protein